MKKNIIFVVLAGLSFNAEAYQYTIVQKQILIQQHNANQPTGLEHLTPKENVVPNVTIWVHATKFMSFVGDYAHATPRPGLIHISEFSWTYRLKSLLQTISAADPIQFPLEHLYAFGWSGVLSFDERKKEAQNLYNAIKLLMVTYKNKYGVEPHITLIGHSHGGNVILNVARVKDKDFTTKITAIMLGCPVQHETQEAIHDPLFEKVYSFYSESDWIQAGDPQGFYLNDTNHERHWELSSRMFCFDAKMRQAQLQINSWGIWHLGYIRHYFLEILPRLVKELDAWEIEMPSRPLQERVLLVNY